MIEFLNWYGFIGVVTFLITWVCFIIFMKTKNAPKPIYYLMLLTVGLVGWLLDIFWNIFYATPIFQMWPDIHKGMKISDITLSHRLRQILRHDTHITPGMTRWKIADVLCKYFIEPHACTHCGRNK